jgi:outer membrane immunogenic protein
MVAVTLLGSPVLAADLQLTRAPAAYNWTGLYFGAHCGGGWGNTTTTGNAGAFDRNRATAYELDPSGLMCGGQVGFNVQSGGWFWGIEGDFGYLGAKKSATAPTDFVEVAYGAYGTATGRAGVALDRALLYVKGGVAFAKIRNTATDINGGGVVDTSDFSELNKTQFGWTAGAGVEYALSPSWSVKVEYLYMDFGKDSSSNQDGDTFSHRNSIHTAKAGFNWRFGGGPAMAHY